MVGSSAAIRRTIGTLPNLVGAGSVGDPHRVRPVNAGSRVSRPATRIALVDSPSVAMRRTNVTGKVTACTATVEAKNTATAATTASSTGVRPCSAGDWLAGAVISWWLRRVQRVDVRVVLLAGTLDLDRSSLAGVGTRLDPGHLLVDPLARLVVVHKFDQCPSRRSFSRAQ